MSTHGLVLARPAAWRARVSAVIPLPTMLSHTLVAWTVEVDNAFEQRMPHCTTASRRRGEAVQGPWLVSFPMYVHCMRHLTAEGVRRGELEDRARVLGPVLGLERWGYVTLAPAPRQGKRKADPRATIVSPTRAGRKAQRLWAALPDEVEARWNARYGPASLRRLRKSLIAAAANLDSELPDFLPVIHFKAGLLNLLPSDERVTALHRTPRSVHPETTPDPTALPLYTLLSRVLLAFAIGYEHEAELSLALGANVVRVLDDVGVEVAELPRLAGVSKEAIANNLVALGKRGYVVVEKSPGKRTRRAGDVARRCDGSRHAPALSDGAPSRRLPRRRVASSAHRLKGRSALPPGSGVPFRRDAAHPEKRPVEADSGVLLHVSADGVIVGLAPPDAEGVARGVGEHGKALRHTHFAARVELHSAKLQRLRARLFGVLHVQVEMDLLRVPVRPSRRDVLRRALDAHDPAAVPIDDVVPIAVREHPSSEHPGPESAFRLKVCCVEHHYLSDQFHVLIIAAMSPASETRRQVFVKLSTRVASGIHRLAGAASATTRPWSWPSPTRFGRSSSPTVRTIGSTRCPRSSLTSRRIGR